MVKGKRHARSPRVNKPTVVTQDRPLVAWIISNMLDMRLTGLKMDPPAYSNAKESEEEIRDSVV